MNMYKQTKPGAPARRLECVV